MVARLKTDAEVLRSIRRKIDFFRTEYRRGIGQDPAVVVVFGKILLSGDLAGRVEDSIAAIF